MPLHLRSRRNTPLELMMESVLPVAGPFFAVGSRVRRLSVKDRHKTNAAQFPGAREIMRVRTWSYLFIFFVHEVSAVPIYVLPANNQFQGLAANALTLLCFILFSGFHECARGEG